MPFFESSKLNQRIRFVFTSTLCFYCLIWTFTARILFRSDFNCLKFVRIWGYFLDNSEILNEVDKVLFNFDFRCASIAMPRTLRGRRWRTGSFFVLIALRHTVALVFISVSSGKLSYVVRSWLCYKFFFSLIIS